MVRDLVEESSATLEEFDAALPEIEPVEIETHEHPREMAMRPMKYGPHARQAKALLGQLAGWVSGLIAELRIRAALGTNGLSGFKAYAPPNPSRARDRAARLITV
jgi:hypothetical protein